MLRIIHYIASNWNPLNTQRKGEMSQSQHLSPTSEPPVFWSSLIVELQWPDSSQECISSHLFFPHLTQVSTIPRNHIQPLWGRGDFLFWSHICCSLRVCSFAGVVPCPFCLLWGSLGWAVRRKVRGEWGRLRHHMPDTWYTGYSQEQARYFPLCSLLR